MTGRWAAWPALPLQGTLHVVFYKLLAAFQLTHILDSSGLVQEGLSMPLTSRGLEGVSPGCPPNLYPSHSSVCPMGLLPPWGHPMGPGGRSPQISAGQGVWGAVCCKGQLAKGQQGVCKTLSTQGCKIGHRFAKMGHLLGHARARTPCSPTGERYRCGLALELGVGPSAHGLGGSPQTLSKQTSTPKNPGGGGTPERCCKFSIYGGGGGRGWSSAIFYLRCIPKILVKCNIKLWKFSRGKAFLPLTWPANQKGAPHLPHFWQLFSNWAQLKFPKS